MRKLLLFIVGFSPFFLQAQEPAKFVTNDTTLQQSYDWAVKMALHYRGNPSDPAGPWYEAALPSRDAYCMRDVAHQTIGAAICGMNKENKNMLSSFVRNISESKDWCSYWEINKYGKPAPEDYRNDREFWYNLNANFDIIYACWKLYQWTGDKTYISDPAFTAFFRKTTEEYTRKWLLQPESIMTRPLHPNAPEPFNEQDYFHRCRGLASYVENVGDLKVGIDLMATIYRGMLSYAFIHAENGDTAAAAVYRKKAEDYRQLMEGQWWNAAGNRYYTYYTGAGKFGNGEGEMFLLWFDALQDAARRKATVEHLLQSKWNVETMSYMPVILFREGYWQQALDYIRLLSNPATERRQYPEVSFGVVEGIVRGLMGITPDADNNRITTLYRGSNTTTASLSDLQLLGTTISLQHTSSFTILKNQGKRDVLWRATFVGNYKTIKVGNALLKAQQITDNNGHILSFVDIPVGHGKSVKAMLQKSSV
ncbi:hypothetical protein CLV59_101171 [Chitinophaga dinghuensis]|uniref:Alpha-L-rhamnosidase six-hairpin glycosidase domain-containing protein n=2 Tax=Chitinophaga dinghuensis TaxID=1539050 RepID=A0A327WCY7_9BACT|nr:hypothetical protein CLV59_101171 [Chitinophaga dinghuensis]